MLHRQRDIRPGTTTATGRRWPGRLLRALAVWVGLRVIVLIAFRLRSRAANDRLRRIVSRGLNPVMLRLAGRRHFYAARLEHVGRRSGRPRVTPVVARAVPGGFVVPLPYGPSVDWCRNLQAAGSGVLEVDGVRYRVSAPAVLPREDVQGLSGYWRRMSAIYGITHWLAVTTEPAPAPPRTPSAAAVALDARRTTRGGAAAVEHRQQQRLDALVAHARRSSRFYAEHLRDVPDGPVELRRLPRVTKPELMARFDDVVTDPLVTRTAVEGFVADLDNLGRDFLDRYVVVTTSGSTGVPALLVHDERSIAVMTGLATVRSADAVTPRMLAGMVARGMRTAAVFAGGGHFVGSTMFARRLRTHPFRRRITRFFSVLDPLPSLVEQLNAYQPAAIGSYASALTVLADEQRAGRLRISPVMITSGGEVLTPAARRHVEGAFGCAVVETYSASEALPLAQPCARGGLHVNADWFLLEPVDADHEPVPPGEPSHSVLVTNLANLVQPIIRYELGDSVTVDPRPCPCGSPLPTIRVEGRTDEILRLPAADGQPVALLPMALSTVVEDVAGVRRFQIVRTGPAALAVRLETAPGARDAVWAAVRQRLTAHLRTQGLPGVTVDLSPDPPQLGRGGKLRHVVDATAAADLQRTGRPGP